MSYPSISRIIQLKCLVSVSSLKNHQFIMEITTMESQAFFPVSDLGAVTSRPKHAFPKLGPTKQRGISLQGLSSKISCVVLHEKVCYVLGEDLLT